MTDPNRAFPLAVARALEAAEFSMRHLRQGDHLKLYNQLRVTMSTIAPVDSFYIAFFRDEQLLVIPYIYDEEENERPGFQMYGPDGLTAWIKRHRRPYLYSMDQGRLLNKGYTFGDRERVSRDAIAIPLFDGISEESQVMGLASILTYRPNTYDDDVARAFVWLARSVMTVLRREREDLSNRMDLGDLGARPTVVSASVTGVVDIVEYDLSRIQARIEAMIASGTDAATLVRGLHDLLGLCQALQTDIAELLLRPTTEGVDLLVCLTPREREVADLIAEGLTNEQIAEQLVISEPTARTHVTRILKKFGVKQRSAVIAKLRPF